MDSAVMPVPAVTQPGIEPSTTASTTQRAGQPVRLPLDLGTIQVNPKGDLIGGIIEPLQPAAKPLRCLRLMICTRPATTTC
jgi:hypothetical protein